MLPTSLVNVRHHRNRLAPQYLDSSNDSWRSLAEQILAIYRGRSDVTRGEIEDEVEEAVGNHPAQLVARGLAKLLEDRCEFEIVASHSPEELRDRVFLRAAEHRKAGHFDRTQILNEIAAEVGVAPETVEVGMFADLKSEQRLTGFEDISVTRLLERYNVALAQGVLLRSTGVTVEIRRETPARLRQVFRAAKFHRLICEADRDAAGTVTMRVDGPLSLFSATQKYGLQLALFLPSVLNCRDFDLQADVLWGAQKKPKTFVLSASDGLVSHLADSASYTPPELKMFVELFQKKAAGWTIDDESEIYPVGRGYWVPDFRLTHQATGRAVQLEVLGYWRKRSAERHLEMLRQHATTPFLLAVSDQLHIDESEVESLPAEIVRFRQMPTPDEVVRRAEELLTWKK